MEEYPEPDTRLLLCRDSRGQLVDFQEPVEGWIWIWEVIIFGSKMSDWATYYIVEPEKRKTLHPGRTFALCRGDSMHSSLRQVSKLKVDLLGSSSDNYIMFTLFYDIWYVISYEWAPCSNSTSSGQVLWKILKTFWPFLSFSPPQVSYVKQLYHSISYYIITLYILLYDRISCSSLTYWIFIQFWLFEDILTNFVKVQNKKLQSYLVERHVWTLQALRPLVRRLAYW